jgi:hypothetical protein
MRRAILSLITAIFFLSCVQAEGFNPFMDEPVLLALLKEDGLIRQEPPVREADPETDPSKLRPFSIGGRFGVLYPGHSAETGNFLIGPSVGGFFHMPLWGGTLEATLDISSHDAPAETEFDFQILVLGGANYLYHIDRFYVGGGVSLANATLMNEMLLIQAVGGMNVMKRLDLALAFYFPVGNSNNSCMVGLYMGYRFY